MTRVASLLAVVAALAAGCGGPGRARRPQPGIASVARVPDESSSAPVVVPSSAVPSDVPPEAIELPSDVRPALEVIEGRASFYSDALAGRPTASGEPYDPDALTAASRDLPFGTVLRVVRIETGRSVVVRVNDRGPFGRRTRILDLSRAAAEALDMIRAGVVGVRVEILERGATRRD